MAGNSRTFNKMTLSEEFMHAMWSRDEKKVSQLIDRMDSETVNELYETEESEWSEYSIRTPLLEACAFGNNIEIVFRLLAIPGIAVNLTDERGKTSLHHGCANNYFQIVGQLLATPGINANCKDVFGLTPLHMACQNNHPQIIAKLQAFPDIDVNSRDDYYLGPTPIMVAAMKGKSEALKMLLEDSRIDLDIKMKDGKGLEQLVPMRKVDCLEMVMNTRIARGMMLGQRNQENSHKQADMSLLRKLINAMGMCMKSHDDRRSKMIRWGNVILHVSCIYGNIEPVAGLLAIPGIDVNGADVDERTPLHHACSKKHLKIITKLLAAPGINVNAKDESGRTPLHDACSENHVEVVDKLLSVPNINVNCIDDLNERTPLHYACYNNHPEVVARLLAVPDINVNLKDDAGQTPLHLACSIDHWEVVVRLLAKANNMEVSFLCDRLLDKVNSMDVVNVNQLITDVTNVDEDELTALFDACWEKHSQMVANLLAAPGINVNATNEAAQTPLQVVCSMDHSQGAAELMVLKMLLKDSRVDFSMKDSNGNGLEELVSTKANTCLEMINEARKERENDRKHYIVQIDAINHNIDMEELRLRISAEAKEKEIQDLNEKKDLEQSNLDTETTLKQTQLKRKKAELEKQLENLENELIETEQRKASETGLIDNKFKDDVLKLKEKYKEGEGTQKLDNMKKMRNQLTRDLNKFKANLNDNNSSNECDSLET